MTIQKKPSSRTLSEDVFNSPFSEFHEGYRFWQSMELSTSPKYFNLDFEVLYKELASRKALQDFHMIRVSLTTRQLVQAVSMVCNIVRITIGDLVSVCSLIWSVKSVYDLTKEEMTLIRMCENHIRYMVYLMERRLFPLPYTFSKRSFSGNMLLAGASFLRLGIACVGLDSLGHLSLGREIGTELIKVVAENPQESMQLVKYSVENSPELVRLAAEGGSDLCTFLVKNSDTIRELAGDKQVTNYLMNQGLTRFANSPRAIAHMAERVGGLVAKTGQDATIFSESIFNGDFRHPEICLGCKKQVFGKWYACSICWKSGHHENSLCRTCYHSTKYCQKKHALSEVAVGEKYPPYTCDLCMANAPGSWMQCQTCEVDVCHWCFESGYDNPVERQRMKLPKCSNHQPKCAVLFTHMYE